jgi:hypothetical protein
MANIHCCSLGIKVNEKQTQAELLLLRALEAKEEKEKREIIELLKLIFSNKKG